jgi:hypothetical protein
MFSVSSAGGDPAHKAVKIAQKKDGTLLIVVPDTAALLALAEAVEEAVLRVPLAERLAVIDAQEASLQVDFG